MIVRKLVESAANGELRALTALIKMSEIPEARSPDPRLNVAVLSYDEARAAHSYRDLDEAFFQKQEQEWADWGKRLRSGEASIPSLIERELARKVGSMRMPTPRQVSQRKPVVN